MAVQHNKPHDRRGNDPRIDGPYLTDIRAAQEENRREARAKARKLSVAAQNPVKETVSVETEEEDSGESD